MNNTIIRNATSKGILFTCAQSGAVLYLNAFGSITYPNLDLLKEDVKGLVDTEFKMLSAFESDKRGIQNTSATEVMCVQGKMGANVVPVTYIPPHGNLELPKEDVGMSLFVFSGKYEFSISKETMTSLQKPENIAVLYACRTGTVETGNKLSIFVLSRVPTAKDSESLFEVACNDEEVVATSRSCQVSCKTLPVVSLCTTTKTTVVLLVLAAAVLILAVLMLPYFIFTTRKSEGKN